MRATTIFSFMLLTAILIAVFNSSCKTGLTNDKPFDGPNKPNVYKLHLNPDKGSQYSYNISNETDMRIEVGDKKIHNQNKTDIDVLYDINKDSAGNFQYTMNYDKLHFFFKDGDKETEMDASEAADSGDPVTKMLGVLKTA